MQTKQNQFWWKDPRPRLRLRCHWVEQAAAAGLGLHVDTDPAKARGAGGAAQRAPELGLVEWARKRPQRKRRQELSAQPGWLGLPQRGPQGGLL